MNWFQKARESFKNPSKEETVDIYTLQAFSQLMALKTKNAVSQTNKFLDTFNETIFESKSPVRAAAFATGIVGAAITATFIPGMENPAAGAATALDAAKVYFSGVGTPSPEEVNTARKAVLPALQALAILPGAILLSELGFHAKDTFKRVKEPKAPLGPEPEL